MARNKIPVVVPVPSFVRRFVHLSTAALLLITSVWLFIKRESVQPNITRCKIQVGSSVETNCTYPIFFPNQNTTAFITMELSLLKSTRLQLAADDCLLSANMNNTPIAVEPDCNYPIGNVIDFAHLVRPKANELQVQVKNDIGGGQFLLRIPNDDWLVVGYRLFVIVLFISAFASLFSAFQRGMSFDTAAFWFLVGSGIRLGYALSTPYWARAHDWPSHLQYVEFELKQLGIPLAGEGWEFYQPPLYYMAAALFHKAFFNPPASTIELGFDLQLFAVIVSVSALALGLAFASTLPHRAARMCYCAILALSPGLISFSARISNDIFVMLFTFLTFYLLLSYLRRPTPLMWLVICIAFVSCFLSKTSGLALLPSLCFALLIAPGLACRERVGKMLILGVIALIIASGYLYSRHIRQGQTSILSKTAVEVLPLQLRVENNVQNFATLNPLALFRTVFNNPWNNNSRSRFFWEFFLRSAHTGEFDLGISMRGISAVMLFLGLQTLPLFLIGMFQALRRADLSTVAGRERSVMAVTLLSLLGALVVFRLLYPYIPTQDFRHIPLAIVPYAYFTAHGTSVLKTVGPLIVGEYAAALAVFQLMLFLHSVPVHVF